MPTIDERYAHCRLPGAMVRRLMRSRGVTIGDIASKFNITKKRVREVREQGVTGFLASEWHYMITGQWLDQIGTKNDNSIQ